MILTKRNNDVTQFFYGRSYTAVMRTEFDDVWEWWHGWNPIQTQGTGTREECESAAKKYLEDVIGASNPSPVK